MKELLKKHWKSILVFGIVGLILIPFCIHLCFKIKTPIEFFQATWTSGEVLAFYGVVVGSIATVWGVYLSIEYSRSNYKEDVKNRVLPFIAITALKVAYNFDLFKSPKPKDKSDSPEYSEYIADRMYLVIENSKTSIKGALTEEQEQAITRGGYILMEKDNGSSIVSINLYSLPLVLENVGNGVANLFYLGFNNESEDEAKWKYTTAMPLKVGQKINLHVYCENKDNSNIGSYILDTYYEDIYKNKYRQRYRLNIESIDGEIKPSMSLDGIQEVIID